MSRHEFVLDAKEVRDLPDHSHVQVFDVAREVSALRDRLEEIEKVLAALATAVRQRSAGVDAALKDVGYEEN